MNDLTYIQKKFVDYVETVIKSEKLSHAYLIEIGDSSEEFPFILSFIKMILCPEAVSDANCLNCGKCNVCKLLDENNYPDFEIISADGTQIKKGQLVSLKEEFQNTSLIGKRRVYMIEDAEKLNPSSANTILKFLEEPENNIIAILITHNRYKVIDTILSRCQVLSLRDSLNIENIDENVLKFLKFMVQDNDLFVFYKDIYENIMPDKDTAKEVLSQIENTLIEYLSGDNHLLIQKLNFLDKNDHKKLLSYIAIIEEELPKLVYNINYKLWLDSLYSRFVEVN